MNARGMAERLTSGDVVCTRLDAMVESRPRAEPLQLEVHRQRLAAIAEEMGAALMRAAFSAKTSVNRGDFGLTWNQALETGGVMVGDRIDIEIEVEAVKQAEAKTA